MASLRLGLAPLHSGASEGCGEHAWEEVWNTARTVSCEERGLHGWRLSGAQKHGDGPRISVAPHPQGLSARMKHAQRSGREGRRGRGVGCGRGIGPRPRPFLQRPRSSASSPEALPVRRSLQSITTLLCPAEPRQGLSVELCPGAAGRTAFRDIPGKWVWLLPQEGTEAKTEDAAGSKGTGRKQVHVLVKVARRDTPAAPLAPGDPTRVAGPRADMGGQCLRRRTEAGGPRRT